LIITFEYAKTDHHLFEFRNDQEGTKAILVGAFASTTRKIPHQAIPTNNQSTEHIFHSSKHQIYSFYSHTTPAFCPSLFEDQSTVTRLNLQKLIAVRKERAWAAS
jgi:hypothetical protein